MLKKISLSVICAASLSGCATSDSLSKGESGAAVGAVAGAVLGHQVDGRKGRYLGALVGAIAGNAVGRYMDEQQQALEQELSEEAAADEIRISRLADNTLKLNLSSEVSFDFDSAMIKPDFRSSLDKLASVLASYPDTAVHIVGHTDSVGSEGYNQRLSLRRAFSVKEYLVINGVAKARTRTQGYGETMPVSNNATTYGRERNRRVEIYIKPIVQGSETSAFRSPV